MENKNEEKEKLNEEQSVQRKAEEDVKELLMKNNSDEQQTPDTSIQEKGEAFLKRLREMPYTNDKVGKSFVILRSPLLTETQNSETEE
jgi:hypothetical protein